MIYVVYYLRAFVDTGGEGGEGGFLYTRSWECFKVVLIIMRTWSFSLSGER